MKTIAIIEDDQPIGDLLEEALGQAGYATLRAYSAPRLNTSWSGRSPT